MNQDNNNSQKPETPDVSHHATEDSLPDLSRYYTESIGDIDETVSPEDLKLDGGDDGIGLSTIPDDKYLQDSELSQGSMKTILKVKDRDTARNIAMAVLKNVTPTRVKRFIHEARIAANLEHPNIIPIHDIGIDDNRQPFFTMKLVKGETLADILEKLSFNNPEYLKRYDLRHLLEIYKKICDAVAFAHSRGIIHLDLKPENIQVGSFGEVLVLDWGLSKIINRDDFFRSKHMVTRKMFNIDHIDKTIIGAIKGTPGYMAPEQAAGNNELKDTRTDIYSLGAILYSILALRLPFNSDNVHDVILQTIEGNLMPPSEANHKRYIPKALEAVVMKAMAVNPDYRYQTVTEIIDEIDAYQGGFATTAEGAGLLKQTILLMKRNKREVSYLSALFVIVFLGLIVAMVRSHQREKETYQTLQKMKKAQQMADTAMQKMEEAKKRALRALREMQHVQTAKNRISKQAAPEFLGKAQKYLDMHVIDRALATVTIATGLDPSLKEAWLLQGRLYLVKGDCKHALSAFQNAGLTAESKLVRLAETFLVVFKDKPLSPEDKVKLANALQKAGEIQLASLLNPQSGHNTMVKSLVDALRRQNPLLKTLNIDLYHSQDGLVLNLNANANLTDISPLHGLHIRTLNLGYSGISDLTPLKGLPLKEINLFECRALNDLSPLLSCKSLEVITLPPNAKAIDALKALPNIRDIDFLHPEDRNRIHRPAEFWKVYKKRQTRLRPISRFETE